MKKAREKATKAREGAKREGEGRTPGGKKSGFTPASSLALLPACRLPSALLFAPSRAVAALSRAFFAPFSSPSPSSWSASR